MQKVIYAAKSLLRDYWNGGVPVLVKDMVSRIETIRVESDNIQSFRYDASKREHVFVVNESLPFRQQNIWLSECLGRYMLGYNATRPAIDAFINELLLPGIAIRKLVFVHEIADVEKLASMLQTSNANMLKRLKELGMIS